MKILTKLISAAALAIGMVSCNAEVTDTLTRPVEQVEVGFSMPTDTTRTAIADDGKTTHWAVGDKLAVWARSSSGDYVFENTTFSLRHFSETYDKAFFTANIAAMASGEYTYMLSYPQPKSVIGTLATYNVASTQSGKYDGIHDIMVAEPVKEDALTSADMVSLNTVMCHQMHAIKITVPEGRNLFGSRFYRLEITFPQDVVGDVTLDVSDPSEAPIYTNTSNVITVESAEGFDAGDDIWVFVLPGTVDGDVSYKVKSLNQQSVVNTYPLSRNMKAGHVTPISMAIPKLYKYTSFILSEGGNNLGEEFNSFKVYDKNNTLLASFVRNAENRYEFGFEGDIDFSSWENTDLRIVFDSDNAIVENSVNIGKIEPFCQNAVTPFVVPYLFEEDFSGIYKEGESYGNNDYASSDRNQPGAVLDGCMTSKGWNAARYWTLGNSMRINVRYQSAVGFASTHYGRLDTPAMSMLKSSANVDVVVMFDAAAYAHESSSIGILSTSVSLATHTNNANPIDGIPTGKSGLFSSYNTTIDDFGTTHFKMDGLTAVGAEAFNETFPTYTATIKSLQSTSRLCFYPSISTETGLVQTGNAEGNVYIDNIKVQIVKK